MPRSRSGMNVDRLSDTEISANGRNHDSDYRPELGLAVGMWIIALELALALAAISWWMSSSST